MRSSWWNGLIGLLVAAALVPAAAQKLDIEAAQKRFSELYAAGNYSGALAQAQSTEAAARRAGTNNIAYVVALNDLARAHQELGHYTTAAGMFGRVLDALQKNIPPSDPRISQALANLATVQLLQGNSGEAETLYKRALDIATKSLGPNDPALVKLIGNLGDVYTSQARHAEAEVQYQRALELAEKNNGPNSLQVALVLNNLTRLYEDQSRFAEVEKATRRALAIREQALGPDHPDVAASLNNLAHVDERVGRYAEAESLYRRAIGIWENALGPNHPRLATSLLNLASVYADEDRFDEAEALYKRALVIREAAFGANSVGVATVLNNLAAIYESQERYGDVETFARRALVIAETTLGAEHPDTAKVLRKLGVAYDGLRRYAEADAQFRRALAILTKTVGPDHRFLATVLISQGHLFEHQGRPDDAEQAYKRALAINEKWRGVNHPEVARGFNDLASLSLSRDRPAEAVAYSRKATARILAHADEDMSPGLSPTDGSGGLIEQRSDIFVTHVAALAAAARADASSSQTGGREAFEVAQWGIQSSAGTALQQLGPRFAAGNDALAALVRTNQDLSAYLRDRNRALVSALSTLDGASTAARVDDIRKSIADTESKLAANAAQLQQQFPDYAKLSAPRPLAVEGAQKLLGPDEALLLFLTGDKESYVFALTAEAFDWRTLPTGGADLAAEIVKFRKGLDIDNPQPFDLDLASRMFAQLIGPVDGLVRTKRNLLVVSSGALTALPFHLLVTEPPPKAAAPSSSKTPGPDTTPYRDAAWLIKRQAITVLPSVGSLQTLRSFVRRDSNQKPMIGFGDPVFSDEQATGQSRDLGRARGIARAYTEYWRGAGLDRSALASAPRLPDTADELKAVARDLGAAMSDIHLRRDASVTTVKHAPLSDFRIVYFATHGLVAGDIKGLAEPALLLSLPAQPTEEDNGLLTASEAAQLKLDADWVVLSACNTAAGDRPGAQALSGLARAFFFAGARALLVSHWPVDSEAATRLNTMTFAALKADPTLGRAEALRRAMLAYLDDRTSRTNAHPAIWGPFSLIGEGARQ
ncbi:tetratricopeptide repeat protein [Bradyrhizobium sp. HKCCYLR20261]|uniref:CHAT domain-containing tetratricopeptide repeat protein n=1 Tax=Bradyrhizobium sp. HKCCYLR20261 TaxID=3420760 RepID=UPI003EBCAD8D